MFRSDANRKSSGAYAETMNPWNKNLVHVTPLDTLKFNQGNWTPLGEGFLIGRANVCLVPDIPHWFTRVFVTLFAYLAGAKWGRIRNMPRDY